MYEARQNKKKMSRTIDVGSGVRQLIRINDNPIQMKRNQSQKIQPTDQAYESCLGTVGWNRCTRAKIVVPPNVIPFPGSGTSGSAPWKGNLFDSGYGPMSRAATRLHVINSNFGGFGGNDDGNLHPGSQLLNKL